MSDPLVLGKPKYWKTVTLAGHSCPVYRLTNFHKLRNSWGEFDPRDGAPVIHLDASLKGKWLQTILWHEVTHFVEHIYCWDLREDRVAALAVSIVALIPQLEGRK